jgi:hypothetical protein
MIRFSVAVAAMVVVGACSTTVPNDVSETVGRQTQQDFQVRRSLLRGEPQTTTVRIEGSALALEPGQTASVRPDPVMVAAAPEPQAPVAVERARPTRPERPGFGSRFAEMARSVFSGPGAAGRSDGEAQAAIRSGAAAQPEIQTTPLPPQAPRATQAAAPAPATSPRATASNPRISDEQEFEAVAARETIESDAERRARMQANRVEIEATDLPDRPRDLGPNVVDYALSTSNRVGEQRFRRNPLGLSRHAQNCRAFRSADLAQEWFLANGGPQRDRRGLDPDGDGFACDWNPEIYRAALRAARN